MPGCCWPWWQRPAATGQGAARAADRTDALGDSPGTAAEAALEEAPAAPADETADDPVARLERLRHLGDFEAFIDGALAFEDAECDGPLGVLKADALLGVGRSGEATETALAAAAAALEAADTSTARHALRMWATARFRENKSLDDPRFSELVARLSADDALVQMLVFWRDALVGRTVYDGSATDDIARTELARAPATAGSLPGELVAIEARVNGQAAGLTFIDTGAQYTLITHKAAEASGVIVGPRALHLVGFAGVNVRPGVIERLELGELVLKNVPVVVGDSPPLVALAGQLSLGTELMQHVRFAIDYPAARVFAEPAARRSLASIRRRPQWSVPLWTFSQACLCAGSSTPDRWPEC